MYRISVSHLRSLCWLFIYSIATETCYGTRQLDVGRSLSLSVDRVCWWLCFLLPCLRAPGRGVPGFLAGFALAVLFGFFHDPVDAQVDSFQVFSPVSLAKWASPQFENSVQIFTFSSRMMNKQDQVT